MQDECRRWNAQTRSSAATWVKKASKLLKRDFQGLRTESEEDPDGAVLTRLEGAMERETEGSTSAYDESYADKSARGPTLMERRCTRNHRRRELGSHTTCLQVDGKCMSTIRWIFQPQTQRSRPLETGSKLSKSLKTRNDCERSSDDSDVSETNDVRCTVTRIAKATKIRPDEHWNCVAGTARFAKFKARQQR